MSFVESNTSDSQKPASNVNENSPRVAPIDSIPTSILTSDQIKEYTEAFRLFDRDNDGFISQKELSLLIRSLERNPTDNEIQHLIENLVNKDTNLIDCRQFLQMMSVLQHNQPNAIRKELRDIFQSIDTDGNGFIDVDKLRVAMRILFSGNDDMKLSKEELREMIREYDRDKDGRLSFEEFLLMFDGQD